MPILKGIEKTKEEKEMLEMKKQNKDLEITNEEIESETNINEEENKNMNIQSTNVLSNEEMAINVLSSSPLKAINKLMRHLNFRQLLSAKSNIDKKLNQINPPINSKLKKTKKVKAALMVSDLNEKPKVTQKHWHEKINDENKFLKGDIVYIKELGKFGIFEYYSTKQNKVAVSPIKKGSKTEIMTRPWIFNHKKIQLVSRNGQMQPGFIELETEYKKGKAKQVQA